MAAMHRRDAVCACFLAGDAPVAIVVPTHEHVDRALAGLCLRCESFRARGVGHEAGG